MKYKLTKRDIRLMARQRKTEKVDLILDTSDSDWLREVAKEKKGKK